MVCRYKVNKVDYIQERRRSMGFVRSVFRGVGRVLGGVGRAVGSVFRGVGDVVGGVFKWIGSVAKGLLGAVGGIAKMVLGNPIVGSLFGTLGGGILGFALGGPLGAFMGSQLGNQVGTSVGSMWMMSDMQKASMAHTQQMLQFATGGYGGANASAYAMMS